MQVVKLSNNTQFNVLFAEHGANTLTGEKTIEIGVILDEKTSVADVESAFASDSSRIEVGEMVTNEETQAEEFVLSKAFKGYTQIKGYTVDKNFVYNIDEKVDLMRIVMQEPDIRESMKNTNNDIMMALCEVYEMILAGGTQ